MSRILSIVAIVLILSLGFVAGSQASPMVHRGFSTCDSTRLVGAIVKARDGVQLGQIFDLVVDSNGHVDFAIVHQPSPSWEDHLPDRFVVVPFTTLMISKAKSDKISVVFNVDK